MQERNDVITMKGDALTLLGPELKAGDPAPDFTGVNGDLSPFNYQAANGSVDVLVSVPSLDTDVCDMEVRRFNKEAASMQGVNVIVLSMDLPFAQQRWCGAKGVDNVQTLSDHKDADFGSGYGLLIKEARLLARAIVVVDGEGRIGYVQVVSELTNEPDYDAVLKAVQETAG